MFRAADYRISPVGKSIPPLTLRPLETVAWSQEELTPELGAPWGLVEGHQGVVIGARRSYGGRRAGDRGLEETDDAAREVKLEIVEEVRGAETSEFLDGRRVFVDVEPRTAFARLGMPGLEPNLRVRGEGADPGR